MYISVTFIQLFSIKVVDDSLTVKKCVIVNYLDTVLHIIKLMSYQLLLLHPLISLHTCYCLYQKTEILNLHHV